MSLAWQQSNLETDLVVIYNELVRSLEMKYAAYIRGVLKQKSMILDNLQQQFMAHRARIKQAFLVKPEATDLFSMLEEILLMPPSIKTEHGADLSRNTVAAEAAAIPKIKEEELSSGNVSKLAMSKETSVYDSDTETGSFSSASSEFSESDIGDEDVKEKLLREHMDSFAQMYRERKKAKAIKAKSRSRASPKGRSKIKQKSSQIHKCPHCKYTSNKAGNLKKHIRIHSSVKPFKCSFGDCNKRFARKSSFNYHIKAHLGIKNYKCAECGKAFIQKSDLTRHALTHSGKKPHECKYCGERFRQSSHMNTHIQKHHK